MNLGQHRDFNNNEWITWVFLLVFLILVLVKLGYPRRFRTFLSVYVSKNFFLEYANEIAEKLNFFSIALFLVQNLLVAVFLFLCITNFSLVPFENSLWLYIELFLGVSIYLFSLYGIGYLLSRLFSLESVYESIIIYKYSYLKVASIISIPLLLLASYNPTNSEVLFYLMLGGVSFLLTVRWFHILRHNNKLFLERLFYFILYLCALEIAPLLLVYKLAIE